MRGASCGYARRELSVCEVRVAGRLVVLGGGLYARDTGRAIRVSCLT